jgi:hypothetical protein
MEPMKHHQHRQHYSPAAERAEARAAAGADFAAILIIAGLLTLAALTYFDILTRGF